MQISRYTAMYNSESTNWWYRGRRFLLEKLIYSLKLPKDPKILDIGCGTGLTLSFLNNFGKTYGIDISKDAISFCQKRNLKDVFLINETKYPFPDKTFSLITCLDVLEHSKNEKELLKEASRILADDGYLIIFVPAGPLQWSKLDIDSHHQRRYTKNKLKKVLEINGYKVERISYFNFLLYLPILLIRLIQKTPFGKNNTFGVRPDSESNLVNKILEPIFTLDIKSLKFFSPPFGVSLLAICKKDN